MGEMTFSDVERLGAAVGEADETFHMDEDAFRLFYERTARPVWAYLARMTGDARLADDLLQETFYRFLRADAAHDDDAHRRNYLFRIATNLVHDHRRRFRSEPMPIGDSTNAADGSDAAARAVDRVDVSRAFARLKPRERQLLWLAYANGSSHEEIAAALGLKKTSIKLLLFRARRRMAALLGGRGRSGP
jgi:RNA polymerase sigma-70 factor, ECF subfamily